MTYVIDRKMRQTTGKLIDPFDLKEEEFNPREYIHALSILNRFTGHSFYPYSVMQHSINIVSYLRDDNYTRPEEREYLRLAFIHDFAEAWGNDIASPFKTKLPEYKAAMHKIQERINAIVQPEGFSKNAYDIVDFVDKSIYKAERDRMQVFDPDDTGMSDDRPVLDFSACNFNECNWRKVETTGIFIWNILFPERFITAVETVGACVT